MSTVATLLAGLLPASPAVAGAVPPDPHGHVVPVHDTPWKNDMAQDARMVRVERTLPGSDAVLSPDGRWRAFVVSSDDEPGGRLCVETVRGGSRWELREIPLPYRPLSDLVWIDADRLAFDRWSQPHHGVHYVLDVRRRRLVLSVPFPDAFGLGQQTPDRR